MIDNNDDFLNMSKKEALEYCKNFDYNAKDFKYVTLDDIQVSSYRKEVKEFLNNLEIEFEENVEILDNVTVDFFFKKEKVALICNDTYESTLPRIKEKHNFKTKRAAELFFQKLSIDSEDNDIRLIHIFEFEWNNPDQKRVFKNIIKSACNIVKHRIYARKCEIHAVEMKTCDRKLFKELKKFFNENNIQGYKGSRYCTYLTYNDEIVHAFTWGSAFWSKGKIQYELIRGASKHDYTIIGGSSRLWKHFKKTYDPESVVYYIDYNYFNGKSMEHMTDFEFERISAPGIRNYWVLENVVKNREPMRHKLIMELTKRGRILPIYNAGTKVFIYKKK